MMDEERRNGDIREQRDLLMKLDVRVEHVERDQHEMRIDFHETIESIRQEIKAISGYVLKMGGAMAVIIPTLTVLIGLAAKHYFGW